MTTSSRSPAPLAFITGASSGIGQALAWHAYQQGWSLALVARRGDVMAQWAAQQGLEASRFAIYEADVAVPDSISGIALPAGGSIARAKLGACGPYWRGYW